MRALIIPAAGLGTRLGSTVPKALVTINGKSMLDHLAERYSQHVDHTVVVTHPSFAPQIESWAELQESGEVVRQPQPTGMLDAILLALPAVAQVRATSVWITWCDQIAVLPETIARLARETAVTPPPPLVLPTVSRPEPYTHFERDRDGRIVRLLQRREGDAMPAEGESDMGLFALSRETVDVDLQEYARAPAIGRSTGERLFVPFVAWLARRKNVLTFPCTDPMESVGINTREERQQIEAWLRERAR